MSWELRNSEVLETYISIPSKTEATKRPKKLDIGVGTITRVVRKSCSTRELSNDMKYSLNGEHVTTPKQLKTRRIIQSMNIHWGGPICSWLSVLIGSVRVVISCPFTDAIGAKKKQIEQFSSVKTADITTPNRKSKKNPIMKKTGEGIFLWFSQREKGNPISGPVLQEKGFFRIKRRQLEICGEKVPADAEVVEESCAKSREKFHRHNQQILEQNLEKKTQTQVKGTIQMTMSVEGLIKKLRVCEQTDVSEVAEWLKNDEKHDDVDQAILEIVSEPGDPADGSDDEDVCEESMAVMTHTVAQEAALTTYAQQLEPILVVTMILTMAGHHGKKTIVNLKGNYVGLHI
ncbi:hypothetical protein J6590_037691 [Homalodisca vitripennis]|nr:hypothetical protein J6590_037691 [Homalodisca vitripennis]